MGIYVDDVPKTTKQLCELFEVPLSSIPKHRRRVMQMQTRIIDASGTKRSSKSYGGKPEFTAYVKSEQREVKVRYATGQRNMKDNVKVYTPKTTWLMPHEDGSCTITDDSLFVYWWFNPANRSSPLHNPQQGYYYDYQDKNQEAVNDLDREEKIINAMSILIGDNAWTEIQLKQLAKGLSIAGVDDMTPAVVKASLKKLAYADPEKFYNQANSREVVFSGKIQEAIDSKVLVLKSLHGMQRWYLNEEEILPLQYGQNADTEIKNHMAEKWYLYSDKIEAAIKQITIGSLLNNPLNDKAFEETKVVNMARKADLTPEQHALLREIKEKDYLNEKMQKIDGYNLNDPNLHVQQRKSYEDNKHYYEAWLANGKTVEGIEELV